MPVVKKSTALDLYTFPGGFGPFLGAVQATPYSWAKMIYVKIVNQGTALTTAAYAQVAVSNDGTNYYAFRERLVGLLPASAGISWAFIVQPAAQYVRVEWQSGNQNVTIQSAISEIIQTETSVRQLTKQNQISLSGSTSETTLLAAETNFFIDITDLIVSNTSFSPTTVDFRDSLSGTIRLSINLNANSTEIITLSSLLTQAAINNDWTAQSSASVTDVKITAIAQLNT